MHDFIRAVVLLAGGLGTRLKGLASPAFPKQFVRLGGLSSFQEAAMAGHSVASHGCFYVVTHESFHRLVHDQLDEIGLRANVIVESSRDNTCAATALGLTAVESSLGDVSVCVMPSDCLMDGVYPYICEAMKLSYSYKETVLLGVPPRGVDTNFGHMVLGGVGAPCCKRVVHFVEKPAISMAGHMMGSGPCFWNSGIMACQSAEMLASIKASGPFKGMSIDTVVLNRAETLLAMEMVNTSWMDIGSPKNFLSALGHTLSS